MAKQFFVSSLSLLAAAAAAQSSTDPAPAAQQVTVTGSILTTPLSVGGFGDAPLSRTPMAASLITPAQLADAGARQLRDLTRLDAAVSDAYNAEGYWSQLSVRGFTLDNRFNYRRDGLPINAEYAVPLQNKARVELLKGTSGIQAGTSAPGGLANLEVKRPDRRVRSASLGWRERGSVAAAVDVAERFGTDQAFGARVNAAAERLDPPLRHARGEAHLLAVAADARFGASSTLEAEFETSRQSQPSQPGFSLLGSALPDARSVDPRINLNNQPWSLPVVFQANTASLRFTQGLGSDWRFVAHGMTQRLKTDDRVAFPFGCSAEGNFDRYCSDGTFDFYDFRSDGERRRSDALDLHLEGTARTGPLTHRASAGVLFTRFESRFGAQVYSPALDAAGNPTVGTVDGRAVTFPNPPFADDGTNRDERSSEAYVRDAITLSERWSLWAGLRHTRLHRESVRTGIVDPTDLRPTDYRQSFTTPWLALAWQATPQTLAYASWGRGIESDVAPNRARYTNAGQPLPALKSRQFELGLKHDGEAFDASAALFDIERPLAASLGTCDGTPASCTYTFDGTARHRGAETLLSWRAGAWQLHASAMWLDAERRGATANPTLNGRRPANVPARTLRLLASYDVAALPGLALLGALAHEGDRLTGTQSEVRVPSWTRLDLGARYTHAAGAARLTWRLGVDNAANRRAWKEAPVQFDHVYLYPMAPRTWRVSLQAQL